MATSRPRWPMIILRTPKGWTGPHEVDGKPVEGSFRSHQVPMADVRTNPHLRVLEAWLRVLPPRGAVRRGRALVPDLAALAPRGRSPDERQPARQRSAAAQGPAPA